MRVKATMIIVALLLILLLAGCNRPLWLPANHPADAYRPYPGAYPVLAPFDPAIGFQGAPPAVGGSLGGG